MQPHPLIELFQDVARGVYPLFDAQTEVLPAPPGAHGAVLAFTGHHVVAAEVDPAWVADRCPPGDLIAPLRPAFLVELGERIGSAPSPIASVLCGAALPGEPDLELVPIGADVVSERISRALRRRTEPRFFQTPDGAGLVTLGRGLAERWESGFEVAEAARNVGLGRRLASAVRHLVPAGEAVFMQVAVGNIASLRAVLAAGYAPVGVEVLYFGGNA